MAYVSVIIPTYNRADLVANAIESVLSQTYKDFEIIVVDDGSTDNTRSRIESYMGKINYYYQNNKGKSVATNLGIERALGKWIAILDSDDVWLPEKLKFQLEALINVGDGCGLCFTDAKFVNNPNINGSAFERIGKKYPMDYGRIENPTSYVLSAPHGIYIVTTLIDKKLIESVGGFDPKLRVGQDTDMIFKISMQTNFVYVNKSLVEIDRTLHRKQGNIEIYRKDLQLALTCRQHMYENWYALGQILKYDLQKKIRIRLAGVHNDWANWHIINDRLQRALEELEKAYRLSSSYRLQVKKFIFRYFPSTSRIFYKKRGMKATQNI
jgi:glycosyltransferase involved in cell wall biosynthesis